MGFFDSKDCCILTSTDEYLSEEASTFLVFKSVDGEYLSTIDLGESKDSLDLIETFLEFALIEEHNHIRIVDDSLLDDRRADNILDLLCYHTDGSPELACCLVEILDILCHHR